MTRPFLAAAAQFEVGSNQELNLEKTLHFIKTASESGAELLVLPEFLNHCSWYDSQEHCFEVSLDIDSRFITHVKEHAKQLGLHVVANVTLRRDNGKITGTSLLISSTGDILSTTDKQVLIGHENDYLIASAKPSKVVNTQIGKIGTYACMDGVIFETPRMLALAGAQVLCNSLNSFARCEGDLHIPVRAAENKVFVVAANKVGPLIPLEMLGMVAEQINIPKEGLYGAGDSQIVHPNGDILKKADNKEECVISVLIDPKEAIGKERPDGTTIFKHRRPELYKPLAGAPKEAPAATNQPAAEVRVAIMQPIHKNYMAIDEVTNTIKEGGKYSILTLPALFCFDAENYQDPIEAKTISSTAIDMITKALQEANSDALVATSLIMETARGHQHCGVTINHTGIIHRQPQLHVPPAPKPALQPGLDLKVIDTQWGRMAMIVGRDSLYPESFRLAAIKGAHFVLTPFDLQESWEVNYGLAERAAENRICIVAATQESSIGASIFATLHDDYTIMTPWKERKFDGNISYPIITRTPKKPGLFESKIHPQRSTNKILSHRTNIVNSRPWHVMEELFT